MAEDRTIDLSNHFAVAKSPGLHVGRRVQKIKDRSAIKDRKHRSLVYEMKSN